MAKMTDDLTTYERLEIRCPKLGGEVTFKYCQAEAGDLPCQRTILCWHSYFSVDIYLKGKLTEYEWDRFCNQGPQDKMTTLVELIEEAKERKRLSTKNGD
jgi:hypothetical protein